MGGVLQWLMERFQSPPEPDASPENRRRFRRVNVPIYARPARLRLTPLPVTNIGMGGMRVYSDDARKVGQRLELDVTLPDKSIATVIVEVAWLVALEGDAPAKYDVGLRFISVPPGFLQVLPDLPGELT